MPGSSNDRGDGFFLVGDPVSSLPYRGRFDATVEEAVAFSRAETSPAVPVSVAWGMGGATPSDVVWTTLGSPLVVSRRFLQLLQTGGFTGWDTYRVEVVDKAGNEVPGYAGLTVTGRCDPVDLSRSDVVLRELPGGWFPYLRGHFFPLASWDGSDLFMERKDERGAETLTLYATARLRDAIVRARITNLHFENVAEVQTGVSGYAIGKTYRLPSDIEARVARAYAHAGVPRPPNV